MMVNGTYDARGYNQWKTVGRQVKKGSKLYYITAPCLIKVPKLNENGGEIEDEFEYKLVGFRPYQFIGKKILMARSWNMSL